MVLITHWKLIPGLILLPKDVTSLMPVSNSATWEAKFGCYAQFARNINTQILPNVEYGYNKHDKDSSWQDHFAL